ncbi:MAG: fatty acid desaturase family protein [Planctomycetota bacterium]
MSGSTYNYSPYHRALEISSIFGLGVIVSMIFYEVYLGLVEPFRDQALWLVPSVAFVAYLAADFVSGFVHFVGDTFGHEELPVLGPNFIRPFREHHTDPRAITRHDFVETNGNNCVVCIPAALLVYFLVPARTELWGNALAAFCAWFFVWIFMTNQFHKWSHLEVIPPWIQTLQRWRLILNPEHHDIHHTAPFDKYFCITTGWLNPLLYHLRFFPAVEGLVRWVSGSPEWLVGPSTGLAPGAGPSAAQPGTEEGDSSSASSTPTP